MSTPSFSTTPNTLKVMTLNIAHGRAENFHQIFVSKEGIRKNLTRISNVVSQYDTDILALQEIDGSSIWSGTFDHSAHIAEQTHLKHHVRGSHVKTSRLDYGTSVMSRLPIVAKGSHTFHPAPLLPHKGFVWADIDHPSVPQGLRVISLHLDFALKGIRKKQLDELVTHLKEGDRLLIIMGDFNMRWTPNLQEFCAKLDLHTYQPDLLFVTFPKTKSRLDWILVSKELKLINHKVLYDKLSDHRAVVAQIQLPELLSPPIEND